MISAAENIGHRQWSYGPYVEYLCRRPYKLRLAVDIIRTMCYICGP